MSYVALEAVHGFDILGEDAQTFLQGLTTQNVRSLVPNHGQHTAFCNQKGRVIGAGLLFQIEENRYRFVTARNNISTLQSHLIHYRLRAKVNFDNTTPSCIGMIGMPKTFSKHNPIKSGQGFELDNTSWVCWEANTPRFLVWPPTPPSSMESDDFWTWLDLQQKTPLVTEVLSGHFTPHALGYRDLGWIAFNKGCYLGQEIVSRTEHLGKVKKTLAHYQHNTNALPQGINCLDENEQNVGTILLSCQQHSLVHVDISALAKSLHVNHNNLVDTLTPKTLD